MALHNDVFKLQIWEWFCNDIDSCLRVAREIETHGEKSEFKGALNYTAALTIFSVIEFAAGFYVGGDPAKNDGIAKFIAKYIGQSYSKLKNQSVAKQWYEVFRNGLSHQWSPKEGSVAMDFTCQEVFTFETPEGGTEKIPALIVPKLFEVVKTALHDYEADLNSEAALQKKFEDRFKQLRKDDGLKMKTLRELCEPSDHAAGSNERG